MSQDRRRKDVRVEDIAGLLKKVEQDMAKQVKPKIKPEELKIKGPKEYFKVRGGR